MYRKRRPQIAFIATLCLFLIFCLDGITSFDYAVDESIWVHYGKVQQNQGFILDTQNAPPLPFWIFGLAFSLTDNAFAPRFANIAIFLLTISATFILLKNTDISHRTKLIFLSAVMLNPYFILYSRLAMTDIIYTSAIWLSILTLYISLTKESKKHLYASALFFALSSLAKHISLLFWPLFIVLLISRQKQSIITKKSIIHYTLLSASGFMLMSIADAIAYTNTGDIYSFAGRILAIANSVPFITIGTENAQGTLITSIPQIISKIISYSIAILIYTAPLMPLTYQNLKRTHKEKNNTDTGTNIQKPILILILAMFAISAFLREGYMRQLIVVYPIIYLFAALNTTEKRYAKTIAILIIYCVAIDINAFIQKDSIIFGSSKDYLENVPDTKIQLYSYVNNLTEKDDIVLVQSYSDNLDARPCLLTEESATNPPTGTRYIIYKPAESPERLSEIMESYQLEEVFGYKNTTVYYLYSKKLTQETDKSECTEIAKTIMLKDIL